MTSKKFNTAVTLAKAEMAAFDSFSAPLRSAVRASGVSSRVVLNALLRGVSEAQIIERLTRSQSNEVK